MAVENMRPCGQSRIRERERHTAMPKNVKVIETIDTNGETHHSAVAVETSSAPTSTKVSAPVKQPTTLSPDALVSARRAALASQSQRETRDARRHAGVTMLAALQGVRAMLDTIDTLSFASMASRRHLEASMLAASIRERIGDAHEIDTSSDAGAALYNDIVALCALLASRMPTGNREAHVAALARDVRATLANVRYVPLAIPATHADALRRITALEDKRAASAAKRANEVAALLGIPASTSGDTGDTGDTNDAGE